MNHWVCVRLDKNKLWTADLYDKQVLVKTMSGSYPKASQVVKDVKQHWGANIPVKIMPNGNIPVLRKED